MLSSSRSAKTIAELTSWVYAAVISPIVTSEMVADVSWHVEFAWQTAGIVIWASAQVRPCSLLLLGWSNIWTWVTSWYPSCFRTWIFLHFLPCLSVWRGTLAPFSFSVLQELRFRKLPITSAASASLCRSASLLPLVILIIIALSKSSNRFEIKIIQNQFAGFRIVVFHDSF